jgi:hypothetical protein
VRRLPHEGHPEEEVEPTACVGIRPRRKDRILILNKGREFLAARSASKRSKPHRTGGVCHWLNFAE